MRNNIVSCVFFKNAGATTINLFYKTTNVACAVAVNDIAFATVHSLNKGPFHSL